MFASHDVNWGKLKPRATQPHTGNYSDPFQLTYNATWSAQGRPSHLRTASDKDPLTPYAYTSSPLPPLTRGDTHPTPAEAWRGGKKREWEYGALTPLASGSEALAPTSTSTEVARTRDEVRAAITVTSRELSQQHRKSPSTEFVSRETGDLSPAEIEILDSSRPVAGGGYCDLYKGIYTPTGLCLALRRPWFCTQEPMDVEDAKRIFGIVSGLAYLHRNCIIHGEVKAANVLLDIEVRPALCDFGMTNILEGAESVTSTVMKGAGSLRWMSSEMINNSPRT
ncbi:hypothetical protein FRB95_006097 [Tulasnella sp. JGI-2019a]|nr:hypothetical protein FRB95_006097 [Tulasnella sp. JGI-2019a]